MKKIFCFVIIAAMVLAACQPKIQPVVVDLNASKAEVNALMETYLTAWNAKDVNTLIFMIAEDGLYCGTDPTELMDKKTISEAWKQVFSDSTTNIVFTVDKREIRVVSNGESALIMEQHIANPYTPEIPWRLVSHAVKTADGWKLDFK
ncbi:MAG: SgcJ/EcaC family oxidoreductase [Bacteroidota bacterium]|nr:SgcJ/EcaC family oxidoreductase [Bacteroidota bacterium]